ncbi:class I SAM-dependent methyltransferase [Streptomyces sp. NPDC058741]|uniref:class I SAM-dependent methyltransferase n=1 Tax=unclassified Streptomyces TaxID=2593676 RepID=UPI00367BE956
MATDTRLLDLAERVPRSSPHDDIAKVRLYDLGMRRSALMAYKRPTDRILAHVRDGMTDLVEVGFTTGLLSLHVAGKLPDLAVSGVEENQNLVDVAEDNLTPAVWANSAGDVEFEMAKLNRLPFPDGSADIVFSFSSLHRWRRPVETLKECARICKPDGVVIIEDMNRHAEEGHITFILDAAGLRGNEYGPHQRAVLRCAGARLLTGDDRLPGSPLGRRLHPDRPLRPAVAGPGSPAVDRDAKQRVPCPHLPQRPRQGLLADLPVDLGDQGELDGVPVHGEVDGPLERSEFPHRLRVRMAHRHAGPPSSLM